MDIAEIFTWYFEQKGVENPERFLDQEKLQFMKQNEKLQMVTQSNNVMSQLTQIMSPQPVNIKQDEQSKDEENNTDEEIEQTTPVLPKLYELAKQHISSENNEN